MKKTIQLILLFGCISQLSSGQLTNLNFGIEAGVSNYSSNYFNGNTNLSKLPKTDHPISNAVFAIHLRQQIASFMDIGAKYSISTIRDLNLNLKNSNGFESEFNSLHFNTRIYPDAFFWGDKEPFAHVFFGFGGFYGNHHIKKFRASNDAEILEYNNKKSISGISGLNYEAGIEIKLSNSAGFVLSHEWFDLSNDQFNDFVRNDESPNYKLSNFKIGLMFDLGGSSYKKIPIKKWNSTKTLRSKRIQIAKAEIERKKGKKIIIIKRKKNTGNNSPKYLVSNNDTIENITIIDHSNEKKVHFEKPLMKNTMHQTVFTDGKETVVNTTNLGKKEVSQSEIRQYIADLILPESYVDSAQNTPSDSNELAVVNTITDPKKEHKKINIKNFTDNNKNAKTHNTEVNSEVTNEKVNKKMTSQSFEEKPIKNVSNKRKKGINISQFIGLVKRNKELKRQEIIEDTSSSQETKIVQESKSDSTYISALTDEINNSKQNNITPTAMAISIESDKSEQKNIVKNTTGNYGKETKTPSLREKELEPLLENGIKESPIDVNNFVRKDQTSNQLTLDNSIAKMNLKEIKLIKSTTKKTEAIQKNNSKDLTDIDDQKAHKKTTSLIENQTINEPSNVIQNIAQNLSISPIATVVKNANNTIPVVEPKTEEKKTTKEKVKNNIASSIVNKGEQEKVTNASAETFDDNFMLHHPAQKSKKTVFNVSTPVDGSLHQHTNKKKEKIQNEISYSREEPTLKTKEQIIKTLKYSKDSHVLSKGDQKKLKEIIVMLRKNPNKKIHLELLGKNPLNSKRMALLYTDFTVKNSIDETRIVSQKYTTNSTKQDVLRVIVSK